MRWILERWLQAVMGTENNILFKPLWELVGRKGVSKSSGNVNIWTVEYLWGWKKMLCWKCLSPYHIIGIQLQWLMESRSQTVKADLKNSMCLEFSCSAFSKEKVGTVDYRISYLKGSLNITGIRWSTLEVRWFLEGSN